MNKRTDKDNETSNDTKTVPVQIKLLPATIEVIENLKAEFHTTNRTNIIVRGIKILEYLKKEENEGTELIIRRKDGTERLLQLL